MPEAVQERRVPVTFRQALWDAIQCREPEFLVEGGAGTGKTLALLWRMDENARNHPGYRGLIVRKELVNLGRTALRTLEENVYTDWDRTEKASVWDNVRFFGGSQNEPAAYMYKNGSSIVVGGMDEPRKVLGSEYDEIYANEITELTEEDWETLTGRLRHGVLSVMSMFGDCNPSYDRHWVLKRCQAGKMKRFRTVLRDNPAYYTADGRLTPLGAGYLERLEGMTGTRRQRFLLGEWVGMENAIYADLLDASRQFVQVPESTRWTGRAYRGIDYGRVHLSAILTLSESADGRLWVRECWAENGGSLQAIEDADRRHRRLYGGVYGVTDPIQEVLAQRLGYNAAKASGGSRKMRIEIVRGLLQDDVLRFDKFGPGVQDLWDEMHMYRYEVKETDVSIDEVPVRKDEDRVAALEYASEAQHRYGRRAPAPQTQKQMEFAFRRPEPEEDSFSRLARPVMRG